MVCLASMHLATSCSTFRQASSGSDSAEAKPTAEGSWPPAPQETVLSRTVPSEGRVSDVHFWVQKSEQHNREHIIPSKHTAVAAPLAVCAGGQASSAAVVHTTMPDNASQSHSPSQSQSQASRPAQQAPIDSEHFFRQRPSDSQILQGFLLQVFMIVPVFFCCLDSSTKNTKYRLGTGLGFAVDLLIVGCVLVPVGVSTVATECSTGFRPGQFFCTNSIAGGAMEVIGGILLCVGLVVLLAGLCDCSRASQYVVCPNDKCQADSLNEDVCAKCGTDLWLYPLKCVHCNRMHSATYGSPACATCGSNLQPDRSVTAAPASQSSCCASDCTCSV